MKTINVNRRLADGTTFRLGTAWETHDGRWRFIPNVAGRRTSKKAWPDWESSLPDWVDYPDGCETEIAS